MGFGGNAHLRRVGKPSAPPHSVDLQNIDRRMKTASVGCMPGVLNRSSIVSLMSISPVPGCLRNTKAADTTAWASEIAGFILWILLASRRYEHYFDMRKALIAPHWGLKSSILTAFKMD